MWSICKKRIACLLTAVLTGSLCACSAGDAVQTTDTAAETGEIPMTVTVTEQTEGSIYDYVIDVPSGRAITILQLSDLQTMEMDGVRNENRYHQIGNAFFSDNVHDQETQTWRYVDEAVARAAPDLIVLAGDIIYGQTDDDGSQWLEVCRKWTAIRFRGWSSSATMTTKVRWGCCGRLNRSGHRNTAF